MSLDKLKKDFRKRPNHKKAQLLQRFFKTGNGAIMFLSVFPIFLLLKNYFLNFMISNHNPFFKIRYSFVFPSLSYIPISFSRISFLSKSLILISKSFS